MVKNIFFSIYEKNETRFLNKTVIITINGQFVFSLPSAYY